MKKKKEPMLLGSAVLIRCEKYVVPSVSNSFFFFLNDGSSIYVAVSRV